MARAAFDEVKRLVYREELDPADIAVLVPNREARDAFMVATARSGLTFTDAETTSSEAVVVDTVRRFKGLERPAVIFVYRRSKGGTDGIGLHRNDKGSCCTVNCMPTERPTLDRKRPVVDCFPSKHMRQN